MLLPIAILASAVLLWLYATWTKVRRFWADRGVPHDKPHPVYGSLTFLQAQNPGTFMINLFRRFRAPYVGIWLFWRPALVINSPEIARNVLVKDSDNFRNRLLGSGSAESDPIGGLNLFTVNEPIWSFVRQRLTSVFTSAKLKALSNLNLRKSKELVQRIQNDLDQKKEINLRHLYADYTTDTIGTAAFGVDCSATLTGESPMRTVTHDMMRYNFIRGWSWTTIFFLPEVVRLFKFKFFTTASMEYFRRVYQAILAQRGDWDDSAKQKDLVDALLKLRHDAIKNNEEVSDDLIIAQAAIFLFGGFETSAATLSFLTYELAFNPEAQEKMYEELLEAKEKLGDSDFDGTVLSELAYVNCVIKETLRKYPPMGWLDRTSASDYKIDESLTIPAGTTVYVNAIGMHHDAEYFPEPEQFVPERFLPENQKNIKPFTYMPFGEGPRNCIGTRFAYRTLWYAISTVFLEYKVRPKPNAKKPSQIEIQKRGLLYMPGEDLYVDFIPRV